MLRSRPSRCFDYQVGSADQGEPLDLRPLEPAHKALDLDLSISIPRSRVSSHRRCSTSISDPQAISIPIASSLIPRSAKNLDLDPCRSRSKSISSNPSISIPSNLESLDLESLDLDRPRISIPSISIPRSADPSISIRSISIPRSSISSSLESLQISIPRSRSLDLVSLDLDTLDLKEVPRSRSLEVSTFSISTPKISTPRFSTPRSRPLDLDEKGGGGLDQIRISKTLDLAYPRISHPS